MKNTIMNTVMHASQQHRIYFPIAMNIPAPYSATENAIRRQNPNRSGWHRWVMAVSAAAVVLLIVGSGVALFNGRTTQPVTMDNLGPIDEFLSSLSDEEAAQLPFYEVEEIPEYD